MQAYEDEQREYYISTAAWSDVHPSQLVSAPVCIKEYDLLKVTVGQLEAPLKVQPQRPVCIADLLVRIKEHGMLHAALRLVSFCCLAVHPLPGCCAPHSGCRW